MLGGPIKAFLFNPLGCKAILSWGRRGIGLWVDLSQALSVEQSQFFLPFVSYVYRGSLSNPESSGLSIAQLIFEEDSHLIEGLYHRIQWLR